MRWAISKIRSFVALLPVLIKTPSVEHLWQPVLCLTAGLPVRCGLPAALAPGLPPLPYRSPFFGESVGSFGSVLRINHDFLQWVTAKECGFQGQVRAQENSLF